MRRKRCQEPNPVKVPDTVVRPTRTGYRNRRVLGPQEHVSAMIGRREIGRIAVAAILPGSEGPLRLER